MKDRYAVFLDLDRTLMTAGVIPQENEDAIREVRRRGHYVFVNTARSYAYIPPEVRVLDYLDGFVAGLGTDLRLDGKQIFSSVMPDEEVRELVAYFLNDPRETVYEGEDVVLWINPKRSYEHKDIVTSVSDLDTRYRGSRISKVYVGGDFTQEEFSRFSGKYMICRHGYYTEFVTRGFDKAKGMYRMLEHLGIPVERCIAMGDSINDKDMLSAAGISVAMGNAIDEIKQMCTYVSCNAVDGGVAQALRKLLLDN